MCVFLSDLDAAETDVMAFHVNRPAMGATGAVALRAPEFEFIGIALAALRTLLFAAQPPRYDCRLDLRLALGHLASDHGLEVFVSGKKTEHAPGGSSLPVRQVCKFYRKRVAPIMPIKSKAQRRKFAELLVKGKISPETFEEWNREAGKDELPERVPRKAKAKSRRAVKSKRAAKSKAAPAKKVSRSTRKRD
jgi:hypothetical protein